jgi:MFS family permease
MRIGFRAVLVAGALLTSVAALLMAIAHDHEWELICAGSLLGAGITFALGASANLIVAAVPQSQVGIATGINTVMRTVGGSFGAAVTTAVLTGHVIRGSRFPSESGYAEAFAIAAAAGLLAFGAALLVPRPGRRAPAPVGAPAPERTGA